MDYERNLPAILESFEKFIGDKPWLAGNNVS